MLRVTAKGEVVEVVSVEDAALPLRTLGAFMRLQERRDATKAARLAVLARRKRDLHS